MIPKIIHCCWFGKKTLPKDVLKNMRSWQKYNPDFEIKLWNEENFDFRSNRYAREAYDAQKWAFVTDYVRLRVLFDHGGIYMDTDVEAVKPFGRMIEHKAFTGFEDEVNISTGTMGAEKGSRWIQLLLQYYDNRGFYLDSGKMDLTTNVLTISQITKQNYPIIFNNTFQNLGDVTIYPFDFLCAKRKDDSAILKTANTVTIHHFSASWASPKIRLIRFLNDHGMNGFVLKLVRIKGLLLRRGERS